jgi:predicted TIM-barrel fold metal-dependent hydrolase
MVIDFHTHVFPPFFEKERRRLFSEEPAFKTLYDSPKTRLASREELLRGMDQAGVDKSVIFGFPWDKPDHFRKHNDYIIESVQHHPDRFVGFCCFSPLSLQSVEEAERCLHAGLSGVGELALYHSGLTPDVQDTLAELMKLCARKDVPVLFHTNEPVGHDYPGKTPMRLSQIYRLIKRYPSNRIVLAHWGGGLLFYGLMKKEVGDAFRNVWFDTAASPYLYTPQVYRVASEIIGPDKILFGSDYPLLSPGRYFQEMKSAGISQEVFRNMAGENARRLLGLS